MNKTHFDGMNLQSKSTNFSGSMFFDIFEHFQTDFFQTQMLILSYPLQ